jgi:hypothetical protein
MVLPSDRQTLHVSLSLRSVNAAKIARFGIRAWAITGSGTRMPPCPLAKPSATSRSVVHDTPRARGREHPLNIGQDDGQQLDRVKRALGFLHLTSLPPYAAPAGLSSRGSGPIGFRRLSVPRLALGSSTARPSRGALFEPPSLAAPHPPDRAAAPGPAAPKQPSF